MGASKTGADTMPSAFFETTKVAWEKVVVTDGAVPAQEFTAAARAIIAIFDQMTGMGIVKGDMEGNIAQLEKNLAAAGSAQSVQALVEAELASGTSASKLAAKASTSCCAALWLTRALYFILKLLERLIEDPARSLSDSVSQGYEATLKQHHNFVVRGTFSAALCAHTSSNARPDTDTHAQAHNTAARLRCTQVCRSEACALHAQAGRRRRERVRLDRAAAAGLQGRAQGQRGLPDGQRRRDQADGQVTSVIP